MKNLLLPCFLLLFSYFSFAQNLVPNPSFEEYDTCPDDIGQMPLGWISYFNSSDYFNSCNDTNAGVPANQLGYQYAATGDGYCGVNVYSTVEKTYREIIGTELITPLEIGKRYLIGFKMVLANTATEATCAANNLGLKFTNYPLNEQVNNSAHLFIQNIITDTVTWTEVNGTFISDSNYTYIKIGNFFDHANTDTIHIYNHLPHFQSYYYIDDIYVIADTANSLEETIKNNIKFCFNNEQLIIQNINGYKALQIIDEEGKVLKNEINQDNAVEARGIDLRNFSYLFLIIIITFSTFKLIYKITNKSK